MGARFVHRRGIDRAHKVTRFGTHTQPFTPDCLPGATVRHRRPHSLHTFVCLHPDHVITRPIQAPVDCRAPRGAAASSLRLPKQAPSEHIYPSRFFLWQHGNFLLIEWVPEVNVVGYATIDIPIRAMMLERLLNFEAIRHRPT